MFQPKLGVAMKMFGWEITDEVLAAVRASRIETLELSPAHFTDQRDPRGARAGALKAMCRETGKRVAAVHAWAGERHDFSSWDERVLADAMRDLQHSIDTAAEFGAPILIVHVSADTVEPDQRTARMRQAVQSLVSVAGHCRDLGVRIALERNMKGRLGNSAAELIQLVDALDETFGICLDTNHCEEAHPRIASDVRTFGDRLFALHVSDYHGGKDEHLLPGRGVVDWRAFMQALRDIDYGGPFTYEAHMDGGTPADKVKSLEENFEWLSAL